MQPIRWGILGLGKIAHKFAKALATVPDAALYGVASRTMDKAVNFTTDFPTALAFGSYEALLDDPQVEAIYIATPHTHHAEWTVAALQKGKAVLCEKPMGMNAREVAAMFETAQKHQRFLMEALWTRFLPSYQKARELVLSGTIGEVRTIQADFGFRATYPPEHRVFNKALGGGSVLDVGIYPLFLATDLLGDPAEVKAIANFDDAGTDLTCGMLLNYGSSVAVLSSSIGVHQSVEARIFGTEGTVFLHNRFHEPTTVSLLRNFVEVERFDFEEPSNGMQHQVLEVHRCLRAGWQESPMMSTADSKRLHAVMDWVRQEAGIIYP